ncbi:hypothetical protein NP233_g11734 [Leucocoprinus birnbaumii]|uniref:Hyaluronan/mRNA-binding protein domain-containing protein n=1 Tax=Leucocoprinus birnbaumii TaxID=56174 RepID=A0AAD5VHM4_9AGAR|nr:hypothetical protein NP233_g11734 [Leucocoprinus birnbaumii]
MTRTERASYPRALNRDRSESRTGMDSSLRKGGAGGHNWGNLNEERRLELDARDDEELEEEEEEETRPSEGTGLRSPAESSEVSSKPPMERSASGTSATTTSSSAITEEDRENARKLRKNAFKKNELDLAAIARSSAAVSGSPPDSDMARRPGSENPQVTI